MEKGKYIPCIVLTGGPCSGKSEGARFLLRELPKYGVRPFVVPELATQVFTNGVSIAEIVKDSSAHARFQRHMVQAQLRLEEMWYEFASLHPGENKVLICDRGALDNMAYCDATLFKAMLREIGRPFGNLLDEHYHGVVHLVTAANGAEAFYNLNNKARHETTLEEACLTDTRTIASWLGHEHLSIINNFEFDVLGNKVPIGFERKMELLVLHVLSALGVPAPLEIERKFLVAPVSLSVLPTPMTWMCMEQSYLRSHDKKITQRVRQRLHGPSGRDGVVHVYTKKKKVSACASNEEEYPITKKKYTALLKKRDPNSYTVRKDRYTFVWEGQYFQLDVVRSPVELTLLEVPLIDEHANVVLPPFLSIVKEVTGDKRYSNASIAALKCPGYEN